MITVEGIRATGLYLLEVLKTEKAVCYSRFYNAAPGTEERLAAGALPFVENPEGCNADELREEGHGMLDDAAWQLEDLGVVRIIFLDDLLIDGEPDFAIHLTERGSAPLPRAWVSASAARTTRSPQPRHPSGCSCSSKAEGPGRR
jgi:hypothetical protein